VRSPPLRLADRGSLRRPFRSLPLLLLLALSACQEEPLQPGTEPPDPDSIPRDQALGVVWEEVPGNPRMPLPDCPTWNCLGNTDPWVGRGPGGQQMAWYSSGGSLGGPVVGRALVTEDLRFLPDPAEAPVLALQEGVWDRYRETVSLRWDEAGQSWTLWYLGYAVSFFDDPALGQMTTTDPRGISWERPAAPIYRPEPGGWDFAFLSGPTFIETPAGEWRLYYTGAGTTVGIGLLRSNDRGATWEPHPDNPVFQRDLDSWDQGLLEPTVLLVNGLYHMWYAGYREPLDLERTPISIGLATSPDGITWTRSPHNPVLGPGAPGSWNDLRVVSPHVTLEADGSLLLFGHGQALAGIGRSLGEIGVWRSRTR